MKKIVAFLVLAFGLESCMSYYHLQGKFNDYFESGDFHNAEKVLEKRTKAAERKNRLLYFFNRGLVAFLQGEPEESNDFFEKAVLFYEQETKNLGLQILTNFSNPNITPYYGEGFEHFYVHYYKALNYLSMNEFESALVECRRLTTKLNALNDMYEGKNKFKNDAFFQTFIGIIYQASKDYNNAFVAYRNALKLYESDYSEFFNINAPRQLKEDLLRTAKLAGLESEYQFYVKEFGWVNKMTHPKDVAEFVMFWHNGLAPIKKEQSLEFIANRRSGQIFFDNARFGISIPVPRDKADRPGYADVKLLKVAFPTYFERRPRVQNAELLSSNGTTSFQLTESVNDLAFKTLEDRLAKESGEAVLRLLTKKAAEMVAREQHDDLGTLVNVVNYVTENADTRSWQTLPHSIYYQRLYLKKGHQEVHFQLHKTGHENYELDAAPGKTYFRVKRTL